MANRFKNTRYMLTRFKIIDGHICTISNDDGTLFSGRYKTKMLPTDLPEWYLYGRYHKRWGYMSTKGIVDMVYRPNLHVNHFLKDDFLYISYKEKIEPVTEEDKKSDRMLRYEEFKGYDDVVFGNEIIDILKGARQYSGFDIAPIIEQVREKEKWLRNKYPDEFSQERWKYDIDAKFAEDISSFARKRIHDVDWQENIIWDKP